MDPSAVQQAKRHLARADRARQQLLNSAEITETRSAWTDFLFAAAGIYEILKVGSRTSGISAAWFGRVVKERKDDELLRYLHRARNSDYHGIKEVTGDNGLRSLKQMPDGTFAGAMTIGEGLSVSNVRTGVINSDGTETEITTPFIETTFATLVAVFDDVHGDTCEVPTNHWGQEMLFFEPLNAAASVMPYLTALVSMAEALSEP